MTPPIPPKLTFLSLLNSIPQKVTTKKRETLILNVDGCIAACFVDLLRSCGAFTQEEVRDTYLAFGGYTTLEVTTRVWGVWTDIIYVIFLSFLIGPALLRFYFQADELIANGCLNGMFVLGRSVGFIGHFLDQKRLKQPLYRHPWDDISYQSVN